MKCEHDLSSSSCQLRERSGKAKALGIGWHERMQDTSSELAHRDMKKEQKKEGNDCVWKRMVSEEQSLSGAPVSVEVGEEQASDNGIKGITIVIHLEGREDVVITAELSQGN